MKPNENIHFLLGQLKAADEYIELLSKKKSKLMKQKLAEAKAARSEVVAQINDLADHSIIYPLRRNSRDA